MGTEFSAHHDAAVAAATAASFLELLEAFHHLLSVHTRIQGDPTGFTQGY